MGVIRKLQDKEDYARLDYGQGCATAQSQKCHVEHSQEQARRIYRPVWLGQINAGVRHAAQRGPAAVHGVARPRHVCVQAAD